MKKILIIEDARNIRMALEDDLKFEGYQVESAATGPEGLEKALDLDLDIIILDLMLPELDGLEICKELRKRNIGTPIIMLTARSQEFDKVLGLELGMLIWMPEKIRENFRLKLINTLIWLY